MAVQPWRKGKVIRIQDETGDTRRFWIEVPELDTFDFIPGQFVTLDLPIHEKVNKRWRSYSIASWPDGSNVFELIIVLDNNILMICTGTGVAPFRSMIHHIKNQNIPHKDIHLVFGCRTKDTLLYFDELTKLQESIPGFHYVPTLSRELWEGKSGYVHPIYEAICEDRKITNFYLCGWKGMIDEAKKRIVEMGYDKKLIHSEIYG